MELREIGWGDMNELDSSGEQDNETPDSTKF
jgi:hypothetical protein